MTRNYLFVWRGGSAVFLEPCRDKGASQANATLLETFNVAHEVGHQFFLGHGDGEVQTPDYRTYLMKTSQQNVFPDNLWFSPVSLNKIRDIEFPQNY